MRSAIQISLNLPCQLSGETLSVANFRGHTSEIIDFALSRSPNLLQVKSMLEKDFPAEDYQGIILHGNQD